MIFKKKSKVIKKNTSFCVSYSSIVAFEKHIFASVFFFLKEQEQSCVVIF